MARKEDPYLHDRNIRWAADLVLVGWPLLLAATGAAAAGWFEFNSWLGILGGFVVGIVLANLILSLYGGRATR
jgi:hypothetical protein